MQSIMSKIKIPKVSQGNKKDWNWYFEEGWVIVSNDYLLGILLECQERSY